VEISEIGMWSRQEYGPRTRALPRLLIKSATSVQRNCILLITRSRAEIYNERRIKAGLGSLKMSPMGKMLNNQQPAFSVEGSQIAVSSLSRRILEDGAAAMKRRGGPFWSTVW
jgi:hypothetical protein